MMCMPSYAKSNIDIREFNERIGKTIDDYYTNLDFEITSKNTAKLKNIYNCNIYNGYKSDYDTIIIPQRVRIDDKTYTVTQIGDQAFYKCEHIKKILIPASVTSIGKFPME